MLPPDADQIVIHVGVDTNPQRRQITEQLAGGRVIDWTFPSMKTTARSAMKNRTKEKPRRVAQGQTPGA